MGHGKSCRVLVVDDEVRALRLVARVLAGDSIECCTATSAAEALGLLAATVDIDVVVSDIHMPGTGGIEFLGEVRRRYPDRPWLQLIIVTGHATLETAVAAIRLEAADYLFKPVEPKALRDSVRHAIGRADSIREVRGTPPGSPGAAQLHEIVETARELADEMRRTVEPGSSLHTLRLLQKLQEARNSIFGEAVMPEPAWEMLAELMRARLAGQPLSVTSLALASRSPMTTALRRIEDLIQGGLAVRVPDAADRRRTHVELTPEGLARMRVFLDGFAGTVFNPDEGSASE